MLSGWSHGEGACQPELFICTGLLAISYALILEACCAITVGIILYAVLSDEQLI